MPQVTGLINTRLALANIDTTSPNPTTVTITPCGVLQVSRGDGRRQRRRDERADRDAVPDGLGRRDDELGRR